VDGTQPIPAGSFDPAKFIGGYDFAGPLYDANTADPLPGSTPVPTPDENPIDATYLSDNVGHGSHVSGTAAGYGVLPDGQTFHGDYSSLTSVADWQVGPGTAPGAQLFALKVFGDIGGSTDLATSATGSTWSTCRSAATAPPPTTRTTCWWTSCPHSDPSS
jgi:hypothetical protein